MSHIRLASVVLVSAVALVGCSSADDTAATRDEGSTSAKETTASTTTATTEGTPTSPTVEPSESGESSATVAADDRVQGTGYSVALPSGWLDVTDEAKQRNSQADIAVAEPQGAGFRTNFNVVQPNPLGQATRQQLVGQAARELRSVTKTRVTSLEDEKFDGESAIGQTSRTSIQGFHISLVQYLIIHEKLVYAVTMTFDGARADAARSTLDTIIESWQWA